MRVPALRKGTYANVVATLALVVAMSGTAYALVVTSADIQDGTIQSIDIADNGVKAADINAGAVQAPEIAANAVNGPRVQDGSLGVADLAKTARTSLWQTYQEQIQTVSGTPTKVAEITVPRPGWVLLDADAMVRQANSAGVANDSVSCQLYNKTGDFVILTRGAMLNDGPSGMNVSIHLAQAVQIAVPTTYQLRCYGNGTANDVVDARLAGMHVDELNPSS